MITEQSVTACRDVVVAEINGVENISIAEKKTIIHFVNRLHEMTCALADLHISAAKHKAESDEYPEPHMDYVMD